MKIFRIISSITIVLAFAYPAILSGQQIITTSGGGGSGTGGKVSYTVGQVINNAYTSDGGSVVEGVQQPYEISVETGVDIASINISIKAFPNPTADFLTVIIQDYQTKNLSFELFDLDGKLKASGKINSSETIVKMNELIPAVYFLKISSKEKDIKVFKIIKN
jgi:hypothetical protein